MCKYSNAIEPLKRTKIDLDILDCSPILLFIDYL
jgi:hypothetical protein